MSYPRLMTAADTGLLVIDVQEKLMALIPGAAVVIDNIGFLLDVAAVLGIPVVASEQYPQGLGPTVPELARRLAERTAKLAFSCGGVPEIVQRFQRQARPQVLLVGIETHVCVQQTALDLLAQDFRVYVAADALASRFEVDHRAAVRRMEQAGVVITTAEAAAFEWLGRAGTAEFKTVSKLVQERMKRLRPH
jgi:nicotinamidase-related amidase